jgi:hypothetical protein
MHFNCNNYTEKYNIKTDINCDPKSLAIISNLINTYVMKICTRRDSSETGFPLNLSPEEVQIFNVILLIFDVEASGGESGTV